MLIVGSCAFANAQEVASPEPSVQAVVGYADEINIRGLSYGGDGILAGANAKIPTKWVDLYAGGYHLLASEEETQSHFAAGAKKAWNVADIAFSTTAGISSHQINNPNIDSTAAVSLKIGIDNDPTGISKWINPSLSLWKDDYDYEQLSLKVSTDLNVLGVDIEPSLKLTYLDNDVDVDSLKADSQTSVWAGFTYKF